MIELSPKEVLIQGKNLLFPFQEGERYDMPFLPGLAEEEIETFEKNLPGPLPDEIRELLIFTEGFELGNFGSINFLGNNNFGLKDALPNALTLMADSHNNFWLIDIAPESGRWTWVWLVSHNPPVMALQAHSLSEFLSQLLKAANNEQPNWLQHVTKKAVWEIWENDPGFLKRTNALEKDTDLRDFALAGKEGDRFYDLRDAELGQGIPWGVYGVDARLRRHPELPLFSIKGKSGKSMWQRLFG